MRVAVVHNFHAAAVPSGEDEVVRAEVAALERGGVDVRLVGCSNDEVGAGVAATLRAGFVTATGIGPSPLDRLHGVSPDVIHVHNLFPHWGRRWIAHAPAPIVTTQHSYRAMCANGYLSRGGQVCTLCLDGRRWSGVRYACYRDSRLATLAPAIAGRRGVTGDVLLGRAARVIVLSNRSLEVFRDAGVSEHKLVRDDHFLPAELADVAVATPEPRREVAAATTWLFVGRLSVEKGVDRLVAAWPADIPLRIVGSGPLAASVRAQAAGKRVEFTGHLEREAVLREMVGAVGLVVPSVWFETFGLIYMEAMAAGLPVLAFPPNVVSDVVTEHGTGMVGDWERVEDQVRAATRCFPALRERCRRTFERHYTEAGWMARRRRLYAEVAAAAA